MAKHDIVYILKNDIQPEELRYSIRSVVKNFPYKRIWFAGGQPDVLKPDKAMPIDQTGATKWEKVRNTLIDVCSNDEITEDFWLFNDDFFIMKKISDMDTMIAGTIKHRIERIERNRGGQSGYTKQLRIALRALNRDGYDQLDYAVHAPMLINRKKALETLRTFPECPMFRSLYGNQHSIGGIVTSDVKILRVDEEPSKDSSLLSTNDRAFREGLAGKYIRDKFTVPSKYETDGKD